MEKGILRKREKLIGWAAIVIFVVFTAAVCWFVGRPMGNFVSEPEKFRLWVESHGLWSQAAYVGMVFLQVLVAVIPGEPLEISGGYAFGAVQGTVLCMLGAFLGSVVVFAFVRRFGRELVEIFSPRRRSSPCVFAELPQAGSAVLDRIRCAGDAQGSAVLLCRADRSVLGQVAADLFSGPPSLHHYLHRGRKRRGRQAVPVCHLVFAGTMALSAVGLLIYRGLCRRHEKKQGGET